MSVTPRPPRRRVPLASRAEAAAASPAPDTRHLTPEPHPFIPMRSGRVWDLVEPDPAAIHWPDLGEQ
jgi:hypothetical protein